MITDQNQGAHSARVEMRLFIRGASIGITHMGPDFVLVESPMDSAPGTASIVLEVDDSESRWDVRLPNGVSKDSNRVSIDPILDPMVGRKAFSLLELLVVLAIVGILAAIALPSLNSFKPNIGATAGRQFLADVNHARQLAISQHTTVFMVFVPTNFTLDAMGAGAAPMSAWPATEQVKATNLVEKQLTGYGYVALRTIGDQPGQHTPHYIGQWKTLPDGAYIAPVKFSNPAYTIPPTNNQNFASTLVNGSIAQQYIHPFRITNCIPFPSEFFTLNYLPPAQVYATLPYIAFNYLGQLSDAAGKPTGTNEFIPLVKGGILYPRRGSGQAQIPPNYQVAPTLAEKPAGNWTNAYNVVEIDWLTGRSRLQSPAVQ